MATLASALASMAHSRLARSLIGPLPTPLSAKPFNVEKPTMSMTYAEKHTAWAANVAAGFTKERMDTDVSRLELCPTSVIPGKMPAGRNDVHSGNVPGWVPPGQRAACDM